MPPRHLPRWTKTRTAKSPATRCAPLLTAAALAIPADARANAPVGIAPALTGLTAPVATVPVVDSIVPTGPDVPTNVPAVIDLVPAVTGPVPIGPTGPLTSARMPNG